MNGPVVGIVGAGAVGQTLATSLIAAGLPERLHIVARRPEQVQGLTADLQDLAHTVRSRSRAEAGEVADLRGCNAVVIALRTDFTNTTSGSRSPASSSPSAPMPPMPS